MDDSKQVRNGKHKLQFQHIWGGKTSWDDRHFRRSLVKYGLDWLRGFQPAGPWKTPPPVEGVHRPYNMPCATVLVCECSQDTLWVFKLQQIDLIDFMLLTGESAAVEGKLLTVYFQESRSCMTWVFFFQTCAHQLDCVLTKTGWNSMWHWSMLICKRLFCIRVVQLIT